MEDQAAKLLETINGLIQAGADKLPWAAEQSIHALQMYWAWYSIMGLLMFLAGLPLTVVLAQRAGQGEEETLGWIGGMAVSFIVAVVGIGMFLTNIGGWISPLGRILSSRIG